MNTLPKFTSLAKDGARQSYSIGCDPLIRKLDSLGAGFLCQNLWRKKGTESLKES